MNGRKKEHESNGKIKNKDGRRKADHINNNINVNRPNTNMMWRLLYQIKAMKQICFLQQTCFKYRYIWVKQ